MILKNYERRIEIPLRFFGSIQKKYLIFLVCFISAMLFFTLFGARGILQIYRLKEEREKIKTVNFRLQEENQKITGQIERMRHGKKEVEKIARDEMGLVKKGEIVYQFERQEK